MKKIAVLGSTGSIGKNTLRIVSDNPDNFEIVSLAAGRNIDLLADQVRNFLPKLVSVIKKADAKRLEKLIETRNTKVVWGQEGLCEAACHAEAEMVVVAVVGAAGLLPTWKAIEEGKEIALANKETLVTAGSLFMRKVKESGVKLIPVDSEHSAIFQSLEGHNSNELRKILLTASGGPFRGWKQKEMGRVTP